MRHLQLLLAAVQEGGDQGAGRRGAGLLRRGLLPQVPGLVLQGKCAPGSGAPQSEAAPVRSAVPLSGVGAVSETYRVFMSLNGNVSDDQSELNFSR